MLPDSFSPLSAPTITIHNDDAPSHSPGSGTPVSTSAVAENSAPSPAVALDNAPGKSQSLRLRDAWESTKHRYSQNGRGERRKSTDNRIAGAVPIPNVPVIPGKVFNHDISKYADPVNNLWEPAGRYLTRRAAALLSAPQTFFYLRHHINGLPTEFALSIATLETLLLPLRYPLGQIIKGAKEEADSKNNGRNHDQDFVLFMALGKIIQRHLIAAGARSLQSGTTATKDKFAALAARLRSGEEPAVNGLMATESDRRVSVNSQTPLTADISEGDDASFLVESTNTEEMLENGLSVKQQKRLSTAEEAFKQYRTGPKGEQETRKIWSMIDGLAEDLPLEAFAEDLMSQVMALEDTPSNSKQATSSDNTM